MGEPILNMVCPMRGKQMMGSCGCIMEDLVEDGYVSLEEEADEVAVVVDDG